MFPDSFETDRLEYRRFHRCNISPDELYRFISTENPTIAEETEYLPWDPVDTIKGAADRIQRYEQLWEAKERAEWLIFQGTDENEETAEFVGSTGLIFEWDKRLAIFAIWLRKPFWGNEYSGERAEALLRIAFDDLDLEVAAIPLHSENAKSYAAVEKYVDRYGGQYEGLLRNHAGRYDEPADHHRFSISQAEFLNSTRAE